MTDTTKTPEEPDGRAEPSGAVSTGAPGGDGATAGGENPVPRPTPAPRANGAAETGGKPDDAAASAGHTPEPASGPGPETGVGEAAPGPADADRNGSGRGTWDGPSARATTAPVAWSDEPGPGGSDSPTVTFAAPSPAPGPVPTPGPGAASPPPWRRLPDHEPGAPDAFDPDAAPRERPVTTATDLLDDVPTAFVEPASDVVPPETTSAAASSASSSERAGWSSMRTRARPPRRAALQLKRLDPWSVLKLALVVSGVLFLIWMVAVGLLYGVLDGMGVWDRLNGTYSDLVSGDGASGGQALISAWRVFGYAALFGIINSVLVAVALTVSAFIYNVCADLVGGVEVTLSERD